jgi:hypothetical protein
MFVVGILRFQKWFGVDVLDVQIGIFFGWATVLAIFN